MELTKYTPNTIIDIDKLIRELREVRLKGYALNDG